MTRTIAIIGAGFSGVLTALHLLRRHDETQIVLIEQSGAYGPGAAYGESQEGHLLNVRAGNMSAFPDRPDHLVNWLHDRGVEAGAGGFVDRRTYGLYIREQLGVVLADPFVARRLRLVHDVATSVRRTPGGPVVGLGRDWTLPADAVVLALGQFSPAKPAGLGDTPYIGDPWAPQAFDELDPDARIVILGTGLTMIDVAGALIASGGRQPIFALSRHGLLPHRHDGPPGGPRPRPAEQPLSRRLSAFRRSARDDWRNAFDALRPHTSDLWAALPQTERARFLRHLKPYWDIHRHRLAPAVADRVDQWRAAGRLSINAGRLIGADRGVVTWRVRGGDAVRRVENAVLINCTGPASDIRSAGSRLLDSLLSAGAARPDALRLGLDLTPDGALIAADGSVQPDLFAIGPLARSALWESTAVPDLRRQAVDIARTVSRALERRPRQRRTAGAIG